MSTVPRNTRQRRAVIDVLTSVTGFSSAQQIHSHLQQRAQNVGLSTVYRTLQALAEAGEVDSIHDGEEILYRQCNDYHHHHHLVCRSCGDAVEVNGPATERWADSVAEEHGFIDVTHTLEIFGTCNECATQAR